MSESARRGSSEKRKLLEFWRGILKRRRCSPSRRATKRTGAYFETLESRVLLSGCLEGALVDTDLSSYQDTGCHQRKRDMVEWIKNKDNTERISVDDFPSLWTLSRARDGGRGRGSGRGVPLGL